MYSYVGWRLIWTLNIPSHYKIILIILIGLFYLFPIITFILYFNKIENNFSRIIIWLGYTGLGMISLLFFMQISMDLLSAINKIIIHKSHFDPQRRAFLGLSIKGIVGTLGAVGTIWGFYNATKTPVIKKIAIPIKNLPEALKGVRLAQITLSLIHI